MAHGRVTLKQVAKLAGVSINTVSRALNNKPDISEETKRLVLKAASDLNYVPNLLAQGLRGKFARSIGVVVADIANPFFAEVIQGIEEVAFERGFAITVGNSDENPDKETVLVRTFANQHVAGILLTPCQKNDESIRLLLGMKIPFVLIARRFELLSTNAVLNDDYSGAYQAVHHLLNAGRRRILFLNGPGPMWSATQRLQGYRSVIEAHGLSVADDLIRTCEPTMHGAFEAMTRIITEGIPMDAVFTFNDYMALGVMKALRNAGIRIPQDVAVMGYDGIDIGEMFEPTLSTVSIAKRRLGQEATGILLDMIESGDTGTPKQLILPPTLLIRGST